MFAGTLGPPPLSRFTSSPWSTTSSVIGAPAQDTSGGSPATDSAWASAASPQRCLVGRAEPATLGHHRPPDGHPPSPLTTLPTSVTGVRHHQVAAPAISRGSGKVLSVSHGVLVKAVTGALATGLGCGRGSRCPPKARADRQNVDGGDQHHGGPGDDDLPGRTGKTRHGRGQRGRRRRERRGGGCWPAKHRGALGYLAGPAIGVPPTTLTTGMMSGGCPTLTLNVVGALQVDNRGGSQGGVGEPHGVDRINVMQVGQAPLAHPPSGPPRGRWRTTSRRKRGRRHGQAPAAVRSRSPWAHPQTACRRRQAPEAQA